MKKLIVLFFIFGLSLNANAQKTSKDSIAVFYDKLFATLKKEYLHKNEVDWKAVKAETNQDLLKYDTFKSSLQEVAVLFDKINATHCKVYFQDQEFSVKHTVDKESLSDAFKAKYATKPGFEIKLIDGKYGYILMPAIKFNDISAQNVHNVAQPLYDKIADFKTQNNVEGWIVDLRFNTGGNTWPMLLALYDFLGNNHIWGTLNADKKQDVKTRLENGAYYDNATKSFYINPKGALLDKEKVAIITGALTASSGEVTALAFKGRANTIFIGQKTFGMTTANVLRLLPFDCRLVISIAYDCDRNGIFYDHIVPDVAVSKQDNFDDLLLDFNIQEAIKFISAK